jgi:starvation-inducible DNA-binding protein
LRDGDLKFGHALLESWRRATARMANLARILSIALRANVDNAHAAKVGTMNPTASPLDEADRAKIIASLNIRLADASDLYNGAKQAHWNVRAPNFSELHALFDKLADMLSGHVDTIAERVMMLGGVAEGTTSQVGEATELDEFPKALVAGQDNVSALFARLTAYNAGLHETMALADDRGDVNTVTLLSDISLATEKMGWMLSAHLK